MPCCFLRKRRWNRRELHHGDGALREIWSLSSWKSRIIPNCWLPSFFICSRLYKRTITGPKEKLPVLLHMIRFGSLSPGIEYFCFVVLVPAGQFFTRYWGMIPPRGLPSFSASRSLAQLSLSLTEGLSEATHISKDALASKWAAALPGLLSRKQSHLLSLTLRCAAASALQSTEDSTEITIIQCQGSQFLSHGHINIHRRAHTHRHRHTLLSREDRHEQRACTWTHAHNFSLCECMCACQSLSRLPHAADWENRSH